MSKAVMLSIQPKWCELIASGEKTVEVRKTRPSIKTPFKCYIYCTNTRPFLVWGGVFRGNWETEFTHLVGYGRKEAEKIWDVFNGRVIGEFVCDRIYWLHLEDLAISSDAEKHLRGTCLTKGDIAQYLNYTRGTNICDDYDKWNFYGWHISDLVIYDTPKELNEFWAYNEEWHKRFDQQDGYCCYDATNDSGEALIDCAGYEGVYNCYRCWEEWSGWCHRLTRPPQSWCYVEEV